MHGDSNQIHVITHNSLQNAKSLIIFADFVVQGQGLKLVLEDKEFPRGKQQWLPLLELSLPADVQLCQSFLLLTNV